jgi:hypothetical protein
MDNNPGIYLLWPYTARIQDLASVFSKIYGKTPTPKARGSKPPPAPTPIPFTL